LICLISDITGLICMKFRILGFCIKTCQIWTPPLFRLLSFTGYCYN
jgi:hypothetical protein